MNEAEKLRAAGFSEAEIAEYSKPRTQRIVDALDQGSQQYMDTVSSAAKQGLLDIGQGAKQLGLGVLADYEGQKRYTRQVDRQRAEYDQSPAGQSTQGKITRFAAGTAPYMLLPFGQSRTGAALLGGAIGGTQFVPEGGSRASATLGGMAGGAIGREVGALLSKLGGKYANAKGFGGLFESPAARFGQRAEEIIGLGQKHKVPVYAPDVTDSPFIQKAGTFLEEVPGVGMGGSRVAQGKAAKEAAQTLVDKYATGADDYGIALQGSLGRRFQAVRDRKNALYERVGNLSGDTVVPTSRMQAKAEQLLKEELSNPEAYQRADYISALQKYTQSPEANFKKLQLLRGSIGDEVSALRKGTLTTNDQAKANALQDIRRALSQDMEDYATNAGPEISKAWRQADRYYRTSYIPLRDQKLIKNARETDEPDQIFRKFVMDGKRDRARMFYNALDGEGKATVRAQMVQEAMDKANVEAKGGKVVFSPAKFAQELQRQQAAAGVFFRGEAKQEIDGFRKLMRAVERAGQYMENPPTGARLTVSGILTGGAVSAPLFGAASAGQAVGGIVAGALALQKLFTTPAGRDLLLAASKAGEPELAKILARAQSLVAASSAKAGGEEAASYPAPTLQLSQ